MTITIKGKIVEVDDENSHLLKDHKWYLFRNGQNDYAITYENYKRLFLHRLIMNASAEQRVDHRDCNSLNNKRDNLRFATVSGNLFNRGKQRNNTSGFKGISWNKNLKKWWAHIKCHRKAIYLGLFDDPHQAHEAYKKAATEMAGEFARWE